MKNYIEKPRSKKLNPSIIKVMAMIVNAKNIDQLYVAGDWIGNFAQSEHDILAGKFDEIKATLEAA